MSETPGSGGGHAPGAHVPRHAVPSQEVPPGPAGAPDRPSEADIADAPGPGVHRATPPRGRSRWGGWVVFAAAVLVLAGASHVVQGLTALLDPGHFPVRDDGLLVPADWTTWGWVHLGVGVVLVLAGAGVLTARVWAQLLAVTLALASAVVSLAFLAAAPVGATLVVALDVLVVYALSVHGDEVVAPPR